MRIMALAVWCVLMVAATIAQDGATAPPDAIFYNGKIVTVDAGFNLRQAFAVRGDVYTAVGTDAAIRALAGRNTRLVNLQGASVIPGMSDNHDHLYNSGRFMRGIDLVGAATTEEVVRRLRAGMSRFKPGDTVFGSIGWRGTLTRKDLDQISTMVPIVALRGRRGAAVMNTPALAKAGITVTTKNFMGLPMPTDVAGELTGDMPGFPAGLFLIDRVVPVPTPAEDEALITAGQRQRHALGITSIRDQSNWPSGLRAFQRMWQEGKLQLRVAMGIDLPVAPGFDLPDVKDPTRLLRDQAVVTGFGDKWLRIDSQGEEPWPPTSISPTEYTVFVKELNRLGWRPSPHVPTNETLDMVLDAYEAADREQSIRGKRWIIEHIPNATRAQMKRLAALGVIVSTNMAGYAGNYDAAVKTLGQAQAERQTPVRDFLDHKLIVINGSDYSGPNPDTMTPNNPWVPVYYYVSRKTRDGRLLGAAQKISREEALRIATIYNAHVTFEERVKGSIEPGKLADFVVLSADFLTISEEQILQLRPLATYVGGQKVFTAPDAKGIY